jgi:hypothetical protein
MRLRSLAVGAAIGTFAVGAGAMAAPNQSGGLGLGAVACPTARQCTAVGGGGLEVTVRRGVATREIIDKEHSIFDVACPTVTQCTAVTNPGHAVTFDARSPGPAHRSALVLGNLGDGLQGIACPSARQCTATDVSDAYTFDPQTRQRARRMTVGSASAGALMAVSCPSSTQCTAVAFDGEEDTFNPRAGRMLSRATVSDGLADVACPDAGQCTADGIDGVAVTFDPLAPDGFRTDPIDTGSASNGGLLSVACPNAGQCTTVDANGVAVTFDPRSSSVLGRRPVHDAGDVACPTSATCTVAGARIVRFRPVTG